MNYACTKVIRSGDIKTVRFISPDTHGSLSHLSLFLGRVLQRDTQQWAVSPFIEQITSQMTTGHLRLAFWLVAHQSENGPIPSKYYFYQSIRFFAAVL